MYAIACCVRGEMKKLHIERIAASHVSGLVTGLSVVSVYLSPRKVINALYGVPTGMRKIRNDIAT